MSQAPANADGCIHCRDLVVRQLPLLDCEEPPSPASPSAHDPRSWKVSPEPATRSLTVLETRTSPGLRAMRRAPVCHNLPPSVRSSTRRCGGLRELRDQARRPQRSPAHSGSPRVGIEVGEAITGRVHSLPGHCWRRQLVMTVEQLVPGPVTQPPVPSSRQCL